MLSVRRFGGGAGQTCLRGPSKHSPSARYPLRFLLLSKSKLGSTSAPLPSGGAETTPVNETTQAPTPAELRQLGSGQVSWTSFDDFIFRQTEWPLKAITYIHQFFTEAWKILPQFTVPTPAQALQKTALMLSASLLLMVVLASIDSILLWMYVAKARILA